jgi:hypothetical protein
MSHPQARPSPVPGRPPWSDLLLPAPATTGCRHPALLRPEHHHARRRRCLAVTARRWRYGPQRASGTGGGRLTHSSQGPRFGAGSKETAPPPEVIPTHAGWSGGLKQRGTASASHPRARGVETYWPAILAGLAIAFPEHSPAHPLTTRQRLPTDTRATWLEHPPGLNLQQGIRSSATHGIGNLPTSRLQPDHQSRETPPHDQQVPPTPYGCLTSTNRLGRPTYESKAAGQLTRSHWIPRDNVPRIAQRQRNRQIDVSNTAQPLRKCRSDARSS